MKEHNPLIKAIEIKCEKLDVSPPTSVRLELHYKQDPEMCFIPPGSCRINITYKAVINSLKKELGKLNYSCISLSCEEEYYYPVMSMFFNKWRERKNIHKIVIKLNDSHNNTLEEQNNLLDMLEQREIITHKQSEQVSKDLSQYRPAENRM